MLGRLNGYCIPSGKKKKGPDHREGGIGATVQTNPGDRRGLIVTPSPPLGAWVILAS